MIQMDDHIHTNFSDGQNSMEEMIVAAIELGYKRITFTDHIRKESDWIYSYIQEYKRLKKIYDMRIKLELGVETKVVDFDGNVDCPDFVLFDDTIKKVAAIHRIPCGNGCYIGRKEIEEQKEQSFSNYIKAIQGLANNKYLSRIAHPFSLFGELEMEKEDSRWKRVIDSIRMSELPIEFNAKYAHIYVPENIWTVFSDRIVLGSDSHSVTQMVERKDILNLFLFQRKSYGIYI